MITADTEISTDRRQWLTLIVCCCALFMVSLDNTILNVALPSLQRDLDSPISGLQWAVDGYVLVRAVLLFASGAAGDRYGRRRLFRIGLCVFGLASLACSLAPNLGLLVAARCLQAIGGALMTPSSLAIITNTFPAGKARAQAIGFWSATTGLSTAAGPVIGGLLVQSIGWRSVFWVNVPIGAAVLLATRLLRESKADRPRKLDPPGQLSMALTLAALTYALIDAPRHGWGSPVVITLIIVFAVGCAAFVLIERHRTEPMLPLRYFGNRALTGSVVLAVVAYISLGGFTFFNTLYLQDVRLYTPVHAGLLMVPTTAATLLLAPLSGRLTGAIGARLPATLSCLLIAAGTGTLALVVRPATPITVLLIGYLLLGFGIGLINAPITNAAVSSMPPAQAGVAGATTSTARQVGTGMGVALLGAVIFGNSGSALDVITHDPATFTTGLRAGYAVAAALALLGAVQSTLSFPHTKRRPKP